MSVKQESGRIAKQEGHDFEHVIAYKLSEHFNREFVVEGASNTKIDVRDINYGVRLSVKNPKGKNTQIGLYTQSSFISAMGISDPELVDFIGKFFGGDQYSNYPRHRMTKKDIDSNLNDKFLSFLNNRKLDILDLLATHGHNQNGDVNYLIWATRKNDPNSIILIDLNEFKDELMSGEWVQNNTTFDFNVNGNKLFHLQMKGSGTKYTNGYHSLMFHVHRNFNSTYIKNLEVLDNLL